MKLSLTGRSRRSNIHVSVSCLVDGCNADLNECRNYHRRHKVCERHSKTPKVVINGLDQRFCQQCSRFHTLAEFDEVKRSCRKRLDDHNRRRRKSQLVPQAQTTETLVSSQQGTRIMSYDSHQLHPSTAMWSTKPENLIAPYYNQQPLNYTGTQNMYDEASSSYPTNQNQFFECEPTSAYTNRALYLLSLPPALSQQTNVTMPPAPYGQYHYAFAQEMNDNIGFYDSNGFEGTFHDEQDVNLQLAELDNITSSFKWL